MDEKEFDALKEDLERTYDEHERLQKLYRAETGQRWVKPLRLPWPKKRVQGQG